MLRISDQEAIRNPVHYLYTVANNLVKENAVLDRRQASGIDIDEAPAHEQLETLPAFDGTSMRGSGSPRLGVVLRPAPSEMPRRGGPALHARTHLPGDRHPPRGVPQMAKKYVTQALGHCRRRMARLG